MTNLANKTLLITGASRGIGLAIAKRAARDGARIAILAKTIEPHPRLEGTIFSAAEEISTEGGEALPLQCDIRFEDQVESAVARTVQRFGGIDACVNNASAISLTRTVDTEMKRFDLMHSVNTRGTFLVSRTCIPHLEQSANPHILNISPPLNMESRWFAPHVGYTISKYGMSLCVLGMSHELREQGIAVNALWPRTTIATAAVRNLLGGEDMVRRSLKPDVMADAAHAILCRNAGEFTGNFCVDDQVLADAGGHRSFDLQSGSGGGYTTGFLCRSAVKD